MDSLSELLSTRKVIVGVGVVVFIFLLFVGLIVGPSYVFEQEQDETKGYDSLSLFNDDLTGVSFESDTRVEQVQRFGAEKDPWKEYILVKYDEANERVSIRYQDDFETFEEDRIVVKKYFEFDEGAGVYKGYSITRMYDSSDSSWMDLSEYYGGEEEGCLLKDDIVYVDRVTAEEMDGTERLVSGVHLTTMYEAKLLFPLDVEDVGDKRVIRVEDRLFRHISNPLYGFYSTGFERGGITDVTTSDGRIVREKVTSESGDVFYEVTEADLRAEGHYYHGSSDVPLTEFWNPHKIVWEYDQSTTHSDVTVEQPEVVELYKGQCER